MRFVAVLIAAMGFASLQHGTAASAKSAAASPVVSPVLVEMFTSEGCSSCPPADNLLQQLDDHSTVIPGAQLIVLSEHIDYFNHDGWKDPFSSALFTARQYGYVHALGLNDAYTPQILADGVYELWGKTSQQMEDELRQAAAAPKAPVSIREATIDRKDPNVPLLRAHIEVDGTSAKHSGDIYAAVALDHAESQVLRGENGGQHLTYVAVVQVLKTVGKLKKGKTTATDIDLKLSPATAAAHLRLIVFVQESGSGKILGAALQKQID